MEPGAPSLPETCSIRNSGMTKPQSQTSNTPRITFRNLDQLVKFFKQQVEVRGEDAGPIALTEGLNYNPVA